MTDFEIFELISEIKNNTLFGGRKLPSLNYRKDVFSIAYESFLLDYKRWFPNDIIIDEYNFLRTPQLQVLFLYRIAHECYCLPEEDELRKDADTYGLIGRTVGQMEIFYSCKIGKGFKINHGVGSVIGARCRIGDNCMIHQNCTIGDKQGGRPKIGNNVIMYAGSMVLGDITIGDNTVIGANAVVMKSFPDNSILVGSPAINVLNLK